MECLHLHETGRKNFKKVKALTLKEVDDWTPWAHRDDNGGGVYYILWDVSDDGEVEHSGGRGTV